MYQVLITKTASRLIKKLSRADIPRILEKIESLGADPRPSGSKKLKGTNENLWRVRIGVYRIVYLIDDEIRVVKITKVGHRKDIY